jgi:uncharacterized protein YjbJ (UPF0337 family)
MIDQDMLEGKWHAIRGKLKSKWAKLTDNDLLMIDAGVDQLIGAIQHRTGESREAIEHFLDHAASQVSGALDQAGDMAHDAAETANDVMHRAQDRMRERYQQAEQIVHERPAQAMLMAFGLGVVSGLGAALLLTSHRRERERASVCGSLRQSSEQFGKTLSDAIMKSLPQSLGGRR